MNLSLMSELKTDQELEPRTHRRTTFLHFTKDDSLTLFWLSIIDQIPQPFPRTSWILPPPPNNCTPPPLLLKDFKEKKKKERQHFWFPGVLNWLWLAGWGRSYDGTVRVIALVFVLPCPQSLSIHGSKWETEKSTASSSCQLKRKKNTVLQHGTIPFNTLFSFLTVQIGQLVHLWYLLIDGGRLKYFGREWLRTLIQPEAKKKTRQRCYHQKAYLVYWHWFHISQCW